MNTTTTILSRYTTAQKLSGKGSKAGKRKEEERLILSKSAVNFPGKPEENLPVLSNICICKLKFSFLQILQQGAMRNGGEFAGIVKHMHMQVEI